MADRQGQELGNYRLLRLLGQGSFAEVYLGEHTYLGTYAAIKILHTQVTQSNITQFQQEARMLANLVHVHIVRVLDFGVADQTPYLVMDHAPNGTLRQRHPNGMPVPLAAVIAYIKQVAEALQHRPRGHARRLVAGVLVPQRPPCARQPRHGRFIPEGQPARGPT